MKLYIDPGKLSGGPSVFKRRLASAISKYTTAEMVKPGKEFDAEISFVKLSKHRKPQLLRVDGCYFTRDRLAWNRPIANSIKKSRQVVFQSLFSRKMVGLILGLPTKHYPVIHNGVDLDFISSIPARHDIEDDSFVASALWRDNKRPISMVRGFLEATSREHLYVIGKGFKKKIKDRRIHYLDSLKIEQCISLMKACRYQIHLCFIDSCPNAVVEGLACGLKVLCTNLGGTQEIVKDDGVVLDVDRWNFKPVGSAKFDNLQPAVIAEGIHKLLRIQRDHKPDLSIRPVAEKYVQLVEDIV
jgi:glycosyltransferase involved in cell wall biosynthesis